MSNLEKAKEFYLRGFRSTYIKRRTGILAGELKKRFPEIDKAAIRKYQVAYLKSRYTPDEIANALEKELSGSTAERQIKEGNLMVLGCAFGAFDKVFSELLGTDRFYEIKRRAEKIRSNRPPISAQEARMQTMISRYGSKGPNGNPEICTRMMNTLRETNRERYGVDYPMQDPERASKGAETRQAVMLQKYGAANSVQVPEIREKILERRRANGTLTTSKHESTFYELLVQQFGENDVIRNYKDDRYPYYADFYIPSRDLFIELNADRSHNGHWYDPNNEEDQKRVIWMQKRAEEIDKEHLQQGCPIVKAHKSRYWNCIRVWTVLDVEKRKAAQKHNLNYLVFWDSGTHKVNGERRPRLKDVHAWIKAGCPDSKDWNKENTW